MLVTSRNRGGGADGGCGLAPFRSVVILEGCPLIIEVFTAFKCFSEWECWTKTLDAGQHKLKLRHSVYCHPYILMPHEKRQNKGKDIQNLQPSEEAADFEQATMLFDLYFPSFFLY